jgi:ketosteroid isomerase-like protein
MSQENVEIVRNAYSRAARGDFAWFFEETGDDFEFVTSPELPDAGVYRGDEARTWVAAWINSFEALTIESTEIIDAGDKVFIGIRQLGRLPGSQTAVEGRWWQVMTFREGLAVRSELFPDRAEALEAAGLSE